jgi:hypothetical protein
VYLRPLAGAEHLAGGSGRVLCLRRALFGLRQASRAWNKRLEFELTAKGFAQSNADPSLWILRSQDDTSMAMFFVDAGLVAARTTSGEADAHVDLVASMFSIRAFREAQDFLGIEMSRDRDSSTISTCQQHKAESLVVVFHVEGARKAPPTTPEVYGELQVACEGDKVTDIETYLSGIGTLSHLAQCTYSDIAPAVRALAMYSSAPSAAHLAAMLDVIRYVGSTADRGITCGCSESPTEVWCDANFAACLDTRRSTTGWVMVMYGGAVSWSSKKQPTKAASKMKAEYQTCKEIAREGLSVRKASGKLSMLCSDSLLTGPLTVRCDNQAALSLCKDRKEGQRMKHIAIINHFARDRVVSGELQFVDCRSKEIVSDCMTKALPRPLYENGLVGLGMLRV